MIKIDKETILKAKEKVDSFDDDSLNNYIKKLFAFQPAMGVYMGEIEAVFEDASDYYEKYLYYVAVINMAYKYSVDFIPEISSDLIEKWEEINLEFLDNLADKSEEEQEKLSLDLINNHNQVDLLTFIHNELFEDEDEEFDDEMIEYDSQVFWLLKSFIDIYDDNLIESEK
jgi:hypothetical protein